jgi:hypothetical protein
MAKLQEMLDMNNGSFQRAEQMALDFIAKGRSDVYLDLAMLFAVQGNHTGMKQAHDAYAKAFPNCPRLRYVRNATKLYEGDITGLDHIEAGRLLHSLGASPEELGNIQAPQWDGKVSIEGKTVVLYSEGGDGDQIMCVRSSEWLAKKGAKVIVICSKTLKGLFSKLPCVVAVLDYEASKHVKCDYYVPGMSTFRLCGCEWDTLWTGQYIKRPKSDIWERIIPKIEGKLNIGLRWKGLPTFEHEQLRLFPPELMFDATNIPDANLWSLQKDDKDTIVPERITDLSPLLGNWEQTAAAIARMDLVISSCTSIAHLTASMGIPTWVVPPILPYWCWAREGNKSSWYPSVTLFRQETFGTWVEPFAKIKAELAKVKNNADKREIIKQDMLKDIG